MKRIFLTAAMAVLMLVASGAPGMAVCWGDLDNDRDADGSDLAKLIADLGRADCATNPPCRGDIYPIGSPDDVVDGSDVMELSADFGRMDCAFHAPLNLFNYGNSIGVGEAAENDIDTEHPEAVWSTGYDPGSVNSLNKRFKIADPAGFFENNSARNLMFNHAVSGATMFDFQLDAPGIVVAAEATPSGKAGMVTILLGNNDVCADSEAEMTDPDDFETQFREGLDILAASPATKNAYIHVSGIPAIYWLWIAKRSRLWCWLFAWPQVPCQVLLENPLTNDCISDDLDPDTIDYDEDGPGPDQGDGPNCIRRKQFHQAIRDDYNQRISDVVQQYRNEGILPNIYYVDIFDIQFDGNDINNGDCFHPSLAGQQKLAGEQWCRSPWSENDESCTP